MTPYQRIMRAAKAGRGMRLTAREVELLSIDQAIEARADRDDDQHDVEKLCGAAPRGGDGSASCQLASGHDGPHVDGPLSWFPAPDRRRRR